MQSKFSPETYGNLLNSKIQQFNTTLIINKKNLIYNAKYISKICNNTIIAPVIKSDAYGLGVIAITKIYTKLGFKSFFVGNLNEAIKVRKSFKNINIFILNCGMPFNLNTLKKHKLIPVINNMGQLMNFTNLVSNRFPCIIHIDTGMNRLGINFSEILSSETNIKFKNLNIKYLMSHLACAEDKNNILNKTQLIKLEKIKNFFISRTGKKIKTSIANSSGIFLGKKFFLDLVRPGAAFLGINPSSSEPNHFKNVLYLYSHVLQSHLAQKSTTVGYGASYKLKKKSRLATISVGYSNGLSRLLSNIGSVFINDKEAKIVGRISMDLSVVDITDFEETAVKIGDPVEIFGNNRSLEEFAKLNKTIPYEIICQVSKNANKKIIF